MASASEVPEAVKCLCELNSELDKMTEQVKSLEEQVTSQKYSAKDGVDLLGLKNHLLLSYLTGLSNVVLLKTQGVREEPLSKTPVVPQLIEDRVVLEKLRPLEAKFKYQLDKMLRSATTGRTGGEHPLQFRPAPHNLVNKSSQSTARQTDMSDDGDDGGEDEDGEEREPQLYVPPRVLAVPYHEDNKEPSRPHSKSDRHKLLSELRNEWSDLPMEVQTNEDVSASSSRKSADKRDSSKDKQRYEEDYMVRLPHKKSTSQHHGRHHPGQQRMKDSITDFSMFKAITGQSAKGRVKKKHVKHRT